MNNQKTKFTNTTMIELIEKIDEIDTKSRSEKDIADRVTAGQKSGFDVRLI